MQTIICLLVPYTYHSYDRRFHIDGMFPMPSGCLQLTIATDAGRDDHDFTFYRCITPTCSILL